MIDRICDRAARAIELALAVAFMFIVALNFSNVVARYLFGRSMIWADEIQIFTMIAMTFLGAVVVTWRRQHLRMDVLARLLPEPAQAALKLTEIALMLALCGFACVQAIDYTVRMFDIGRTSDGAGVPMWIPHGSLALGFGLIVAVCLCLLYLELRLRWASNKSPVEVSQEGPG